MRSVADTLRLEDLVEASAMAVTERVELSLALGRQAVQLYAASHGVSEEEARTILRLNNRKGRQPCSFLPQDRD